MELVVWRNSENKGNLNLVRSNVRVLPRIPVIHPTATNFHVNLFIVYTLMHCSKKSKIIFPFSHKLFSSITINSSLFACTSQTKSSFSIPSSHSFQPLIHIIIIPSSLRERIEWYCYYLTI